MLTIADRNHGPGRMGGRADVIGGTPPKLGKSVTKRSAQFPADMDSLKIVETVQCRRRSSNAAGYPKRSQTARGESRRTESEKGIWEPDSLEVGGIVKAV
jgi:hypothetical protein